LENKTSPKSLSEIKTRTIGGAMIVGIWLTFLSCAGVGAVRGVTGVDPGGGTAPGGGAAAADLALGAGTRARRAKRYEYNFTIMIDYYSTISANKGCGSGFN
jgi:hypothetical protein